MHRIITIGREFGSGGRELGRRLSETLQFAYYDQEIITEIAKRTDLSEAYVRQVTESRPSISFPIQIGRSFYPAMDTAFQQSLSVYVQQHKLLEELAEKSDCVIVGRCADYILREKKPFRIFVYAAVENKLQRCMSHRPDGEQLGENELRKHIAALDKKRAKYYEFFSDQKWGARENYDLMVNTSGREIKQVSAAVADYLRTVGYAD